MSEVKRYGFLGIVEEEDGEVVKWEDYTALKADRDALAAAHSELRESMAAIHNTIRLDGVNTSLGALLSASKRAHEASVPTDAYLNSVRAEGADKVAEYHFVRIDALKEVSRQGHLFHKAAYSDAVNVANLFRAGKDGE